MKSKRQWQLWGSLFISSVALVLAVRQVNLGDVAETLAQAEYVYLIPAIVTPVLGLAARAVRWRVLLGPEVSLARSFWVTDIGYLVSNVLPFRLGDPARAVVIARGGKISTATALSTVVVERVLDMLTVMVLLAVLTPFVSGAGTAMNAGLFAGGAALAALAVLLLFAFRPDWGRRMAQWGLGLLSKLGLKLDSERWLGMLDGLLEGLAPLRSGWRGVALLVWSVITWAFIVAFYWAVLRAFLPQPPALAAPFLVCIAALGMAVPASPGAVGIFQAAIRYGLTEAFGVPVDQAITVAFGIHIIQYVLGCLLGLIGLGRESLSLSWLRTRAATQKGVGGESQAEEIE
ncbi:MAG: flippase-like domain-containing protein [Chloroflexi bacterium]|nr:flippase-like domain-containing protein [Chloroflexota bacterium]